MDLFSAQEKLDLAANIQNIHDTFSRAITVLSEPTRVIINTNQNPLYKNPRKSTDTILTPNSVTIKARILYGRPQNATFADGTKFNDIPIDIPIGWVRIKVQKSDAYIFSNAKRVVLDGADFTIESWQRQHGLFDVNFATFYLRPIENS